MTEADLHTFTGAYALDALDPEEAEHFARHLSECPACTQEVRELQATAARLAWAAAEVPPAALRERVLAGIREVRQLPPETDVVPLRPRGRRRRLPYLLAAACAALAVAAGGVAVEQHQQAQRQHDAAVSAERQGARLAALMAAPDVAVRTGTLAVGGAATLVSSRRLDESALVYHGLPVPPGDRVYELWYSVDGTMVPAGLLAHGSSSGAALLKGGLDRAAAVGVTVEPAGGSSRPTGSPVLLMPVSA